MAKTKKYTGANITSFEHDVDKVRAKPTQYVGVKGDPMILTIFREVYDNAVDEAIAGRNDHIHIVVDGEQITVIDRGHGFPTEERTFKGKKISALTIAVTELQSGGKMNDAAYAASRGTHGVGVTATNALSSEFKIWTTYKGKVRSQAFKCGKPKTGLIDDKLPSFGHGKHKVKMEKKGTAVSFIPDFSIIGGKAKLNIKDVIAMCDQTAYLNPKLTIVLTIVGKGSKTFRHKGGIADYLKHRIERLQCETLGKPCIIQEKDFDVTFQFTDANGDDLLAGFTNSLPNVDGGVHVDLFRSSLYTVLSNAAGARSKPFKERDLREGLIGLIDWKLSSPEFSSQTKEKLIDGRVKGSKTALVKALEKWAASNKSLVKDIIARAGELASLKEEQLKDKRALRELKTTRNNNKLPPNTKLTTANCRPDQRELFLVEGDSAGGRAKYARFPHQEVLKLRGKILNVARDDKGKAFESQEVLNILLSMGFDPNKKNPFDSLRIGRVILLCDPDPDGHHINTLLLALHHKYLRPLFERNMVYVAHAKEYVASYKGRNYYGSTVDEVRKALPKDAGSKVEVSHIKGWGEVDDSVLREAAFNPETRQLIQIKPVSTEDTKRFDALMREDTEYRRKLLKIEV